MSNLPMGRFDDDYLQLIARDYSESLGNRLAAEILITLREIYRSQIPGESTTAKDAGKGNL